MIISYHPPIFSSLKRLTTKDVKQRIVIRALENRIAIWSPHTILDTIEGGVNDWIADGFRFDVNNSVDVAPIQLFQEKNDVVQITSLVSNNNIDDVKKSLTKVEDIKYLDSIQIQDEERVKMTIICNKASINTIVNTIRSVENNSSITINTSESITNNNKCGTGRLIKLSTAVPLNTIIDQLKIHLKLNYLRVSIPFKIKHTKEMVRDDSIKFILISIKIENQISSSVCRIRKERFTRCQG